MNTLVEGVVIFQEGDLANNLRSGVLFQDWLKKETRSASSRKTACCSLPLNVTL